MSSLCLNICDLPIRQWDKHKMIWLSFLPSANPFVMHCGSSRSWMASDCRPMFVEHCSLHIILFIDGTFTESLDVTIQSQLALENGHVRVEDGQGKASGRNPLFRHLHWICEFSIITTCKVKCNISGIFLLFLLFKQSRYCYTDCVVDWFST
jgi:hypothetical protein